MVIGLLLPRMLIGKHRKLIASFLYIDSNEILFKSKQTFHQICMETNIIRSWAQYNGRILEYSKECGTR